MSGLFWQISFDPQTLAVFLFELLLLLALIVFILFLNSELKFSFVRKKTPPDSFLYILQSLILDTLTLQK